MMSSRRTRPLPGIDLSGAASGRGVPCVRHLEEALMAARHALDPMPVATGATKIEGA
jgi:hypothetical protein